MSDDAQLSRTAKLPIEVPTIPLLHFAKTEASGRLLLLAGMIAPLIRANLPSG